MTKYLIDFKDDASDEAIQEYLISYHCTVIGTFDKLNKVYHVEANTEPPSFESIVELVQNDETTLIKLLEVVPYTVYPTVEETANLVHDDQKNWWKIYSYNQIDLSENTSVVPIFGAGTNIYLVDSGIDASHPEFTGKDVSLLYSMVPGDFDDYTGHGTALASTMIGNTCGISNASLKVVKIFSNDPETNPTKQSDLLYAFDAILQDAVLSTNLISVVNLSWCIPKNEYVEDKIKHLLKAGIIVVTAAGNSGVPIEQVTPASMPEVITVGSYDENFIPCDFSDYTDPTSLSLTQNAVNTGALDIWAPGSKIYIARCSKLGGGYEFSGGTSISSAIQAASIAYNSAQNIIGLESLTMHRDMQGYPDLSWSLTPGRTGILDLSDPKYSSSINKICTFVNRETVDKSFNYYTEKNYNTLKAIRKMIVNFNDRKEMPIGNSLVSKYEIKTQLPDWVRLEGGFLVAAPVNEPSNGATGIETVEIAYTLYPEDTTVEPIDSIMMVVVLGSEFDHTALPADDPILELTALVSCPQTYPDSPTEPALTCFGACPKYITCKTAGGYKNPCACS